MRVGLEATYALAPRFTGVPRYIFELANAFAQLGVPELRCRLLFRLAAFRKRGLMRSYPWPTRWYVPGPWPATPRCDVIHGLGTRVPRRPSRRCALVSTIHDLSPFLLPNYGSERTLRNTRQRYREAGEISDRVIAVSQATKDDYLRLLPIPAERIHVVYHGVSAAFLAQDTTAPGAASRTGPPYLVAFGGNPRKNLARALEAFARSELRGSLEIRVLGSLDAAASEAVRKNRLEDAVRLAPEHDDAGMAQLYRGSAGLIFPSLMEGFGLPLLEAMASGVPVLTSARAGTAEIAGGHALLVDPESIDDIAAGMGRMPSVSRDALTAAASYARTFTWRRTAEQTLAVYRALAG